MTILERERKPVCCIRCAGPVRGVITNMAANMRREAQGQPWEWEEEGTFWVFVWSELVPWPHKITWLMSLGGRQQYDWEVGDLWGVDEQGELLIIESKLVKRREGPFKEFMGHTVPPAAELRSAWLCRLSKEKAFREARPNALGPQDEETWAGVAPISSKRTACRRWRHLYIDMFCPDFDSGV